MLGRGVSFHQKLMGQPYESLHPLNFLVIFDAFSENIIVVSTISYYMNFFLLAFTLMC